MLDNSAKEQKLLIYQKNPTKQSQAHLYLTFPTNGILCWCILETVLVRTLPELSSTHLLYFCYCLRIRETKPSFTNISTEFRNKFRNSRFAFNLLTLKHYPVKGRTFQSLYFYSKMCMFLTHPLKTCIWIMSSYSYLKFSYK